jgi:two-component system, NtrC family, sensor histidine kinase PilS
MLFRVVLITLVFGTTIVLNVATPEDLTLPSAQALFGIVAITYGLTLVYALTVPRVANPVLFADLQVAGDLAVTSALVHVTGGAQSGYVFLFPLSIIGAALVRYRRGAGMAGAASIVLFVLVSVAGWMHWLPTPQGQRLQPWDMPAASLVRQLVLNGGAFAAIAFLSSFLGQQLAVSGEKLETQKLRTADLAQLNEDIIRSLTSGLVTVDGEGTILTFNEAAEEILGVPRQGALGRPIAEIVPEVGSILGDLGERGVLRRGEVSLARGRALGVSLAPLVDARDRAVGRILNFQDLTELRRMEEQMLRQRRLAMVGQLAAGVAHEIRNPLASISGSIELLKSAPEFDEENRQLMAIVLREVERLNGLVTDLLDYARPRERVLVALDLADLVKETVRVYAQDRSAPDVRLDLHVDAAPARVVADPDQVRQVVWNLLRNAAEAMPSGGDLTVRVARSDDEWVELAVIDTGVGIAVDELEKIFDPFYTTKAQGSGLGLATVHRIVTEHGGTIAVTSEPGKGTEFRVRLPAGRDI